ncbi:hypothetical protein PTRA_a1931 [Pseudoalteromonas translucida KMM 520]|uniref:Uncharacterized protein n=1 Tax=Pseudoalteromonas translucida KMM 520 TaxID=1315283 RepID=A0A0U2ISL6_9GAMM|nr:hypothetical protein [Pseudoalteromonas translucida]ALS33071.1 hypothetical protein PTRA_a1931 [Pseudoalteromonas translucida KMM 520]
MSQKKSTPSLPDPFPTDKLRLLQFGSADGHRDKVAEHAFIETSSVKQFYLNQHSIIVGAIGAGKSTLFALLKNHSEKLESYKDDLIVPLEEALSFNELADFVKNHYPDKDEKTLYQLLWKFSILLKIAIELSKHEGFPNNDYEKAVNNFLDDSNSSDAYSNILNKFKKLISNANVKFEAKVGDNPIAIEAGLSDKEPKPQKKINLEEVQRAISDSIKVRNFNCATVIIDKIDKFMAGAEYNVQRQYIGALLEVDDDLSAIQNINLKVFIRADLFERLDFAALGYDKVHDNVIRLKWSHDETLRFLATRIMVGLIRAKICRPEEIFQSTDLTEFDLTWREKLFLNPSVPNIVKNLINKKEKSERVTSMYGKFDKAIITKVFPRCAIHFCSKENKQSELDIFDFIKSHFLDGNGICTPRYMLIFLKEVVEQVASYYDENPDQVSELVLVEKDFEWDLFKKYCVYQAYVTAKDIYIKNIETIDSTWTKNVNVLLAKRGNKTKFDYKWIRANIPDISESEAVDFLSFLQVIGFLKISDAHQDIKKRGYELPILYKLSNMPNKPIKRD